MHRILLMGLLTATAWAEEPAPADAPPVATEPVATGEPAERVEPDTVDLVALLPKPEVDADHGRRLYRQRCAQCHGAKGDGQGPAARYMDPRPRDFTVGQYKIRSTEPGHPASSWDLYRTISEGMRGTAMPGWAEMPAEDRWQLVFFVESFSDRFTGEEPRSIKVPPPPGATPAAVARGAQVYTRLGCAGCHGADGRGNGPAAAGLVNTKGEAILPFDMTRGWRMKGGSAPQDVYRVLHSGIEGTPMPPYHGALSPEDTWDLVYYIQSLSMDFSK